jgi:signal transduction histidine kinase
VSALHSVGARLSLALLVVLAGAFAIAYLVIVPSFELALVNGKTGTLARDVRLLAASIRSVKPAQWQDIVDSAESSYHVRAAVLLSGPGGLVRLDDSARKPSHAFTADAVAQRAAARGSAQGRQNVGEESYAEAAVALPGHRVVVVVSASLHDTLATVALAQRRLLIAAAIAFAFALALGHGGAWFFARRLRRLEHAAEQIAAGHFEQPVLERGSDEIGQLGRAFERMRLRLSQLDRARSEFIGNASHELRTPLFSLGGFLELLSDEELDEPTRAAFLQQMHEQVERLTRLATDLLDLSRLDAGRMTVERVPVDLSAVCRSVAAELGVNAERRGQRIELAGGGPVQALGDEQRVVRIARILLENALVHTPPGTRVRLSAERRGDSAVLAVEDEGPGIPPASRQLVFERFARAEGVVAAGSGLGLAIARELAELMDGRLELDPSTRRTVFSLLLPAAPEPATWSEPRLEPAGAAR